MTKIYGCSDDLVEIEGSTYYEDEIGCYEQAVRIFFDDYTAILIGYPKKGMAVWWIKVERQGTAEQTLTVCEDEDADVYSDVFEIAADVISHEMVDMEAVE